MHAHVRLTDRDGLKPDQPMGVDALLRFDDDAGVSRSALIVIARRGDAEGNRLQNDRVIALAAASNGRFFPIGSVHPLDGDAALAEMARLAAAGVRVVKLHPNTQAFDVADPALDPVVARAGDLGLVLLFDAYKPWDTDEIGKLLLLTLRHPETRFILAHMGASEFRQTAAFGLVRKLGRGGNAWFDVSAIATMYADSPLRDELVWTMRTIGMDHILFGSDWPVDTPADAVAAVRKLGLTRDEERQVFGDNARRLLAEPLRPAS